MRSVARLDEEDEDWERTLRPGIDPTTVNLSSHSHPPLSRSAGHSREPSIEKLQSSVGLVPLSTTGPLPAASSAILTSPRLQTGSSPTIGGVVGGSIIERVVDPAKAASYGHHRQTSIVHGIQHSRNGSLASASSSPLSPQMIAAAGAGMQINVDRDRQQAGGGGGGGGAGGGGPGGIDGVPPVPRFDGSAVEASMGPLQLQSATSPGSRPQTALSGSTAVTNSVVVPERTSSATDATVSSSSHRKGDRTQSGKTRRDHGHNNSHSSRHPTINIKEGQGNVGEYVLHVLFTTVSPLPLCAQDASAEGSYAGIVRLANAGICLM